MPSGMSQLVFLSVSTSCRSIAYRCDIIVSWYGQHKDLFCCRIDGNDHIDIASGISIIKAFCSCINSTDQNTEWFFDDINIINCIFFIDIVDIAVYFSYIVFKILKAFIVFNGIQIHLIDTDTVNGLSFKILYQFNRRCIFFDFDFLVQFVQTDIDIFSIVVCQDSNRSSLQIFFFLNCTHL